MGKEEEKLQTLKDLIMKHSSAYTYGGRIISGPEMLNLVEAILGLVKRCVEESLKKIAR